MKAEYSEDGKTLISVSNAEGTFVIPNGVEIIGDGAFYSRIARIRENPFTGEPFDYTGLSCIVIPINIDQICFGRFH